VSMMRCLEGACIARLDFCTRSRRVRANGALLQAVQSGRSVYGDCRARVPGWQVLTVCGNGALEMGGCVRPLGGWAESYMACELCKGVRWVDLHDGEACVWLRTKCGDLTCRRKHLRLLYSSYCR
jgi:hypothetical protein